MSFYCTQFLWQVLPCFWALKKSVIECNNVVWSMFHADRNVADTLEVREY